MVFNVMAIPGDQAAQTEVVIAGGPAVCVRARVCVCTGKEGGGTYVNYSVKEGGGTGQLSALQKGCS